MKSKTRHHDIGLVLIAIVRILDGVVLLGVGIGALSLIHRDLAGLIAHWADVLDVNPENLFLQKLLVKAGLVRTRHLVWLSAIAFVYAGLMFTLGAGLLREKRWAEYLTAIVTASFIPFEVYELVRHVRAPTIIVLAINVATVIYLVWELVRRPSPGGSSH
jgi:uncharacterized membrane protein (DUF2068 family)